MALGLTLALVAWAVHESLFLWLLPITLGLVFAVPLSWLSGGIRRGRAFAVLGLLRSPEEKRPAAVLARLDEALQRQPPRGEEDALARLACDPALLAWHRAQLAPAQRRPTLADFNASAVTAAWKAEHAATLGELSQCLTPAEALALINQPAGLDRLESLRDGEQPPNLGAPVRN